MRINCYGEPWEGPSYDKNPPGEPFETKDSGGATYLRFGEGERVPIHRLALDAQGIVRRTWAFGKWGEAERLEYIPTTETREVDA